MGDKKNKKKIKLITITIMGKTIIATTTTLKEFKQKEALRPYFETAYGFACFQQIAKAAMAIGGARGTGDVWVRKGAGKNDYYTFADNASSKRSQQADNEDDDYDHLTDETIGKSESSLKKKAEGSTRSTTLMEFDDFMLVGKSTMTQLSIGPQFGGKVYSQIVFFETERDFDNFVVNTPESPKPTSAADFFGVAEEGDKTTKTTTSSKPVKKKTFEFGADAGVVALGANAGANFSTLGNERASARVAGTDHSYEFRLNNAIKYNKGLAVFTVTLAGLMFETCLSGQEYEYKPYHKGGSSSSKSKSGSFRSGSKKSASSSPKEEEREDMFANAQREVTAQIENLRNYAKSVSKKWKKEDDAKVPTNIVTENKENDNDKENKEEDVVKKTPIDAAADSKTAPQMTESSRSFKSVGSSIVPPPGESVKAY